MRSRLLQVSIALHLVIPAFLWLRLDLWPLFVSALAVDHLILMFASLWPQSTLLGPNIRRLPSAASSSGEVALTLDDGPDPQTTPKILDILETRGAQASFFCVGRRAEENPELVAEIARRGHRVENHSYRHSNAFCLFPPGAMRRDIQRAQKVLHQCTGAWPAYFRAPAGLRNPWANLVLTRLGLRLVSWTRRGYDTVSDDWRRVQERLTAGLSAGDVLVLHDGGSAGSREGRPVVLEVLPRLLDELESRGLKAVAIPPPS